MVFLDIYDDGTTLWVANEYYYDSRKERRQKTDELYAEILSDLSAVNIRIWLSSTHRRRALKSFCVAEAIG